jgi:hypothetical protein
MIISTLPKGKAVRVGALLAMLLLIAGCSEIKPFHPPNHREEGPAKGLFTGSQGEWVILGPKAQQKGEEQKKDASQQTGCEGEQKQPPQTSSDGEP